MIRVPLKVGKGNEHLKGEQRTLDLHTDSDEAFKLPDLVVRLCIVRSIRTLCVLSCFKVRKTRGHQVHVHGGI
jgi:hypothetical protein